MQSINLSVVFGVIRWSGAILLSRVIAADERCSEL